MSDKLSVEDLLRAQSEVLTRLHREIDAEGHSPISGHSSHSSGHGSTGGHYSSVARVETIEPKDE